MKQLLECTNNSLLDIINWLKAGNIVCIHINDTGKYFFSKETLTKTTNEKIIYININDSPELLDENEWPWYIKNEGFVEYKSIDIIPKDNDNIYSFTLQP